MIFNRLTLVNFGVYRGEHAFDLRPRATGPIVIIGGKNGAGKTTLLEAIRLCLHGRLALDTHTGRAVKQDDYEQHLRQRIHRSANGVFPLDWARVELEFEYAVAGERQTYTVERSWTLKSPWEHKGKGIQETLHVFQDGQRLDEMDDVQWGHFIRELIPPGLAQLSFLDSEKIQSLANGARDATAQQVTLSQTIKALLGLNVVEQLQADLTIYRRRQQRGNRIDVLEQRIESLEEEQAQAEEEKKQLQAQLENLKTQMSGVEAKIARQEHEIARVGGGFAQKRDEYKATHTRLKMEIESVEQTLRELCAGLLPFAITPAYTTAVKTQLLREAEYQKWLASKAFIEQKLSDIQTEIAAPEFWRGTGAEALTPLQQTIGERVTQTLQSMVEPPEAIRDVTLRHHASEPERAQLLGWIEESQTRLPQQLKQLTAQLNALKEERDRTEQVLQRVPSDDVLGPLVETLNGYNQELGGLVQQQLQLEQALHRLELQGEELERKLTKAYEDKKARQKLAQKIQGVVDVQLVLDDFASRLVQLRVSQLEEAFINSFNRLCRKDYLLRRVAINPRDFAMTLFGASGELISQRELSAGEQQIYAIALLWALRQVSGRPLPVLIDAPLGRLDSDHRQNLVERFFPHASHQVILFSTDTEVDAGFYTAMQDSVSHAYHLDFDQAQQATQVSQGYFWGTNGREAG